MGCWGESVTQVGPVGCTVYTHRRKCTMIKPFFELRKYSMIKSFIELPAVTPHVQAPVWVPGPTSHRRVGKKRKVVPGTHCRGQREERMGGHTPQQPRRLI